MKSIEEQIREIEEELRRTEYNKRTEKHIGKLKAKLARLRRELEKRKAQAASRRVEGIRRIGDGTVVIVGLPNSGKTTLFNLLTGEGSPVSERPFSTTAPASGSLRIGPMLIQVIDTPPLVPGGRNGPILSLVRMADLVLLALAPWDDPEKAFGILMDGGIEFNRERSGVKLLVVRTMSDLGYRPPGIPVNSREGLDTLIRLIPRILNLMVVYTRPPRAKEKSPMVLKRSSKVADAVKRLGIKGWRRLVLERNGVRRDVDPEMPLLEGDVLTVYR